MSAAIRSLLVLALAVSASGCGDKCVFRHPLVDPAAAKPIPWIYGAYASNDGPMDVVETWHISSAGNGYPDGFVRVLVARQRLDPAKDAEEAVVFGFVDQVADDFILHLPLAKDLNLDKSMERWNTRWVPEDVTAYTLFRLRLRPEGFNLSEINAGFVAAHIDAKKLAGEMKLRGQSAVNDDKEPAAAAAEKEKEIFVTANSGELREFFARHIKGELFNEPALKFEFTKE